MSLEAQQNVPIFSLPSEITESVILFLVDNPFSIASFAQTCRYHRSLIYQSADEHLWRNLFLTLYDDPRSVNHLVRDAVERVDWAEEFRKRAWACSSFKSREHVENALRTVLSIVTTAAPHPAQHTVVGPASSALTPRETLIKAHHRAPDFGPHSFDSIEPIKSMLVYRDFVQQGIPADYLHQVYSEPVLPQDCPDTFEIFKYIAYNGLHIRPSDDSSSSTTETESLPLSDDISELQKRILRVSKRHVYNMLYPVRARMYGPFRRRVSQGSRRSCDYEPDWLHLACARLVATELLYVQFNGRPHRKGEFPVQKPTALRGGRWIPMDPDVPRAISLKGATAERDWAGVTGLWRYVICCSVYFELVVIGTSVGDL